MPSIPSGDLKGQKAAVRWGRRPLQGLLLYHKVPETSVMPREITQVKLRQMCLDENLNFQDVYDVPSHIWEIVFRPDDRDRRRELTHTARTEDIVFRDSRLQLDHSQTFEYQEWRKEVTRHTVFPWPYQDPRFDALRLMLQERHQIHFKVLEVPRPGDELDPDSNPDFQHQWDEFRSESMLIADKQLQHGNGIMMKPSQFRDYIKAAVVSQQKITLEHLTLQAYYHRQCEYLEWVFRRCEQGPIFPLFEAEKCNAFFAHYVARCKKRSTISHAHNTHTTTSMALEMRKALNAAGNWERLDAMWVQIMHDDFPISRYQFPDGWMPLHSSYQPASGERFDIFRKYLKQKEAETIKQHYLPHPVTTLARSVPSRSEVQQLFESFMTTDNLELVAQEASCTQSIMRKFCYNQLELRDLEIRHVEDDRQSGETIITKTTFLHFTSRDGKGNSGGFKELGIVRNKILWADSILHLARLFYKRYVWSVDKTKPLLDVDWTDPESWMTHRVAGHSRNDPTAPVPAQASSNEIGRAYKSVLGWEAGRVEQVKKNGGNRREGVNNAARHGATGAELDRQGGWTNSHSASKTAPNVRDKHYMDVQSNMNGMLCAAGYRRDEKPLAAGREKIEFSTVSGIFFGDITRALQHTLQGLSTSSVPKGFKGMEKKTRESEFSRLCAGYHNMHAVFQWFDKVLCQDLPILQHYYPALPSWENPIFHTDRWKAHQQNAVKFYQEYNKPALHHPDTPGWAQELFREMRDIRSAQHQAASFSWGAGVTPSHPHGCEPMQHLARNPTVLQSPAIRTQYPVDVAIPTIEGIKVNGHALEPFTSFLHFWCGFPDTRRRMWHCTYRELTSQHNDDPFFHRKLAVAMRRRYSRAKMVLEVIYNQCFASVSDDSWTTEVAKMMCVPESETWERMSQTARLLDQQYQRLRPETQAGNWEQYIDSLRPQHHRKKKTQEESASSVPTASTPPHAISQVRSQPPPPPPNAQSSGQSSVTENGRSGSFCVWLQVCVCVCVCVCGCADVREWVWGGGLPSVYARVHVCVCVCEREYVCMCVLVRVHVGVSSINRSDVHVHLPSTKLAFMYLSDMNDLVYSYGTANALTGRDVGSVGARAEQGRTGTLLGDTSQGTRKIESTWVHV